MKKGITKEEARYLSDKITLEKNNKEGLGIFTETDLKILRVLPENYIKWKKENIIPEEIFKPQTQVKFYNEEQPMYYDKNSLWWVWSKEEFKWEMSNEVDILNHIEEITGKDIISPNNRTLILNSLKQECRKTRPKDVKLNWIQFKDKIIDIKTGEEFDAAPEWFITNPIPFNLHKEKFELTPVMDEIFEEWVGPNYVKTLYQIIAYSILPSYPIHRLFCFIGEGLNGKSKFLELLTKFVGQDNCATTELDTLLNSRFEVTRLHKKLVCMMGETNFNEMSKTSVLKKLTGGDLIGFEYKNKTPFSEKNYAKILISTNNLPTTTDKTIGFYRRWMIIDFPNQFSEEEDVLERIPEEEYESLALKCTGILHDLLKKRRFHKEGSVEDRMDKFEAKSDFLQKFLDDFLIEGINEYISKPEFRKRFLEWCKENRHREMAENTLSKKLKEKGISGGRKYVDWLYDGKGGQINVYLDIKWKN